MHGHIRNYEAFVQFLYYRKKCNENTQLRNVMNINLAAHGRTARGGASERSERGGEEDGGRATALDSATLVTRLWYIVSGHNHLARLGEVAPRVHS